MACVGFDSTLCVWADYGTEDEYQFLTCCEDNTTTAVTISMDADGFKQLFQNLEQIITTGYDLAKNMVLADDMVWLSRAGLAAKCAVLIVVRAHLCSQCSIKVSHKKLVISRTS